jgi:poly(3-hydroxybutyrate) depolymerase
MRLRGGSSLSLLTVGVWLAATSCGGGGTVKVGGSAGSSGAGTAGTGATGTAGTSATSGTAGTGSGSGAAGASTTGTGGDGAAGASTTGTGTGTAGSGAGGSGGAGSTGSGAGGSGAAGTGGSGVTPPPDGGMPMGLTGKSEGCTKPPADGTGKYNMHMVAVSGIAATVKPATAGASWTNRVYYLDLPAGYNPTTAYPIIFGGGGCGGALISNGNNGGFGVLQANNTMAIQVGMSYVWAQGGGACFNENGADNPDLPYFDAILKEVESNYCVDKGKVFVGGYSSGGWESYMLGLARGGVVRGISPAAGGLHAMRPPDTNVPIAALLLTGGDDTANPATGPSGSDAAMTLILGINKCTGTATVPWATACPGCGCIQYTGCPAAYPVVRCRPPGQGHTDGGGAFKTAIWATWSTLP